MENAGRWFTHENFIFDVKAFDKITELNANIYMFEEGVNYMDWHNPQISQEYLHYIYNEIPDAAIDSIRM